jgi:hypothetical protein
MSLETYVTFQFQLNAKAQRFFESTAAEQGCFRVELKLKSDVGFKAHQ